MGVDYTKYGKVVVNGKKKIVYRKKGSTKNYCKCKGKMIGLSKYKKMVAKKTVSNNITNQKTITYQGRKIKLISFKSSAKDVGGKKCKCSDCPSRPGCICIGCWKGICFYLCIKGNATSDPTKKMKSVSNKTITFQGRKIKLISIKSSAKDVGGKINCSNCPHIPGCFCIGYWREKCHYLCIDIITGDPTK